ncbi:MAG TPA: hypothetical protein VF427_03755 [Noviherbaspirillum sp.]
MGFTSLYWAEPAGIAGAEVDVSPSPSLGPTISPISRREAQKSDCNKGNSFLGQFAIAHLVNSSKR